MKKFLATILACAMLFTLLGVPAFAEEGAVAQIGSQQFDTLQKAIGVASEGDTIEFLSDITQELGVTITDKNLTIDLKGNKFTVTQGDDSTHYRNFLINGSSVVTIKNGTIISEGKTEGETSSGVYGSVRTEGSAKVTMTGLKLYNYRGNGLNVKAYEGTTIAISDTEIYAEYGGGVESAGGTVTLDNVKVEQKGMWKAPYNSMAVSVNGGGKVTVNSGTYTTECLTAEEVKGQGTSHGPWAVGVLNSGGTLIINGGTFSNDNYGENNLAEYARGLVLADTGAKVEINGGTFTALKDIIDYQNSLGVSDNNPVVTINGGTFSKNPASNWVSVSNVLYQDERADGYVTIGTLPKAEVSKLNALTIGDYSNYDLLGNRQLTDGVEPKELQIAMEFVAKDSEKEAKANAFANYTTDFFITVSGLTSGSIVGDGCYLAGNYYPFGWIVIPLDGFTIENGTTYSVITSVGYDFSYVDICTSVKDFKCGIYFPDSVLNANENMEVKLELGISENFDQAAALTDKKYITIDEYTYKTADLMAAEPTSLWTTATDAGYYLDAEDNEQGVMRFLFHADVKNAKVTEYGIKYVKAANIDSNVTGTTEGSFLGTTTKANAFYGDVIGVPKDAVGKDYYAIAYIKLDGVDEPIWSEFVKCSPSFNKLFTEYNGGAN